MMKGVAVPYIIAILLGVAVIGLIGYQLFASAGKVSSAECTNAQRQWCTQWEVVDDELKDLKDKGSTVKPSTFPAGCADVTKTICNGLGIE